MGNVVSLQGFLPPPRWDGFPWTGVRVFESATMADAGTVIDTQVITPDTDPTQPQVRNITTTAATLTVGWYSLQFTDADGNVSGLSDPVRSSVSDDALPPSPDDIRNGSPLLRVDFPIPPTDPFQTNDLRQLVYQATALVEANTWRTIDPTTGCAAPEGYVCELVPDSLVPIAVQAITRMAERIDVTTDPDFARQAATGRRLRGFSAGPYSESYFAPGEFARRGASQGRAPMDPDDALDAALWTLATEDARDYFIWRATGQPAPAGAVNAFDYRRQSIGYTAGMSRFGGYDGGGHGGPDGF